jgi:hypothetical protein
MAKKKSEIEKIADKYYKNHVCFQCDSYFNCKREKSIGMCQSAFSGRLTIHGFVGYIAHSNPELIEQIKTILKIK